VPVIGRRPEKLDAITALNVLHLRPARFTENLFMSAGPIRSMGGFPPIPTTAPATSMDRCEGHR
jgi:hypothetical protein